MNVAPVCGMDAPFHYRSKVIVSVSERAGKTVYGLYEESSHNTVYTPSCLLQSEALNAVLATMKTAMDALHIRPYGFGGVLKNILLRESGRNGDIMVVFVTSADMFHGGRDLTRKLVAAHPRIRTIVQNVQPRRTSVVLGDRERVMYGPGFILDAIAGHVFKISAQSFFQVNPKQTERLYAKALELAQIAPTDTVMDAYCGTGTIGICASSFAGRVIGVEINRAAVRDAIMNARVEDLRNIDFVCADVKEFMRGFSAKVDVLIIDPPRSGCDEAFISAVLRLRPGRIVYISCNPITQARDVRMLQKAYRVDSDAYPFDMFPHTAHTECVLRLSMADIAR